MATSPLDLINSDAFRRRLITRNLTPYAKAPNRPSVQTNVQYIQSDSAVQDSPDQLIDEPSFANVLYPLNQYGAEGGYKQVPDPSANLNTKSNEGEYGYQDANLVDTGYAESEKWRPKNAFGTGVLGVLDSAEYISEPDYIRGGTTLYNNQPYPTTFVPSSYSPVSILLSPDPAGNNGLLSQDSFIAKLGAATLRKEFEERIATQIRQQTVARANIFNADSGTDILNLITGRVPLIEPNFTITVPSNPILAATDFALRLAGSILPVSPIPGSYFDTSIVLGQPTTIQQISNAFRQSDVGILKFFNRLLGTTQTGSQIFLNNTGAGQKSRLFGNLKFNRYKPGYDRNVFDRLAGVIVGTTENNSNYYIGSPTSEPSMIFSPSGDLPVDSFGREIQAPVYGPSELAQLYEGPSREIRLGANAQAYQSGGGIEGGLTWVSPKWRGNAGKKVGIGGEVTNPDENFRPSSYVNTESTNIEFRDGSIMDDTQRIINSQPRGGKRLQHVGNAIDQVSKVFNDGYKELTKGSRVLSYVGSLGQEVGTEYCRVFAKDLPYLYYSDLQKTDGTVTENRRFSYSVLDKTYNLNMYPNKQEGGQDSSNLIGTGNQAYVKKYMFSIENLAWRSSNTPGINVNDLPICERGPNGGRIMWFPPYALTFNESTRAQWKAQDFLGRPEPIYTYTNSSRDGSITWKIVVDHPSILNVIVNKVLSNNNNSERINGLLDSFLAGCKKYDIYELAKKYYTISPNELANLQQILDSKDASREAQAAIRNSTATGNNTTGNQSQPTTQPVQNTPSPQLKNFETFSLFFPNDVPFTSPINSYPSYLTLYGTQFGPNKTYTATTAQTLYDKVIVPNYDHINVQFINSLQSYLDQNPNSKVTITLEGSASGSAPDAYNDELSLRRINSVKSFFSGDSRIQKFFQNGRITWGTDVIKGENAKVQLLEGQKFTMNSSILGPNESCSSTKDTPSTLNVPNPNITSPAAMACRRVTIKTIAVSSAQPTQQPPAPNAPPTPGLPSTNQERPIPSSDLEPKFRKGDWITKRIVRALISECDYFETIKQESPMLYDNLKEKLKFFQPAFHSTTPEGLNSRLTFLQQCLRPGDTIPTVNPREGGGYDLEYNNAINTAFGVPPVLVLRIGDFYNTKIIPNNLQLRFEGLDLNPEGIGIQPMIAEVTLSFNFVGGSGLKSAVDRLQNALSFNYYANTEMWDERADPTDDSLKVISKDFLQMVANPSAPTTNQVQNANGLSNGTTIGTFVTRNTSATTETGTLNYKTFVDDVVSQSQNYFQNFFNQSKSVFQQYNNAILQYWALKNNFQEGELIVEPTPRTNLIGKNDTYQKNIDTLFSNFIDDIDSGADPFVQWINLSEKGFSRRAIDIMKTNYKNFVKNKKGNFANPLAKIIQDTTTTQTNYIQYLSRINVVLFQGGLSQEGTDGYEQPNGKVIAFDLTGTTPQVKTEMVDDLKKVKTALNTYYQLVSTATTFNVGTTQYQGILQYVFDSSNPANLVNEVFYPFSNGLRTGNNPKPLRRQYAVLYNELKSENYQNFKNAVLGELIPNPSIAGRNSLQDFSAQFDNYWISRAKVIFDEENSITTSFLDNLEREKLVNFLNFTPFPANKERVFNYTRVTNATSDQTKLIKSLGAKNNSNNDKQTWNNKDGNVLISKVKLQ